MVTKDQLNELLIAAAKASLGYVYYETKIKYLKNKTICIDIYEKYAPPNRKFDKILEEYGVKAKLHKRKQA